MHFLTFSCCFIYPIRMLKLVWSIIWLFPVWIQFVMEQPVINVYQPTYRLEPEEHEKFFPSQAKVSKRHSSITHPIHTYTYSIYMHPKQRKRRHAHTFKHISNLVCSLLVFVSLEIYVSYIEYFPSYLPLWFSLSSSFSFPLTHPLSFFPFDSIYL